jgi:lipoprotein-releasing system permease protein
LFIFCLFLTTPNPSLKKEGIFGFVLTCPGTLHTAYFIARRIRQADKKAFSTLVHKIGIISIALGLGVAILGLLSLEGFQQNIESKLTSFQGQLQIYQYTLNKTYEELPIPTAKVQGIQSDLLAEIESIQPYAHKTLLLKADEALEGVVCKGVDPRLAREKLNSYLTAGHFITEQQEGYSQEIVLSNQLAAKLNIQVGEEVIACIVQQPPRYRKLKVVGLYSTYLEELDETLAFCDLKLIQRLNGWSDNLVGGYEIFLKDPKQTNRIASQLLDQLDYDLVVKTTDEAYPAIFDWLVVMRKDITMFLSLIFLVAISNIISIVLIQMMERTSMIGLLKALGATDRLVHHIMLWNNLDMVLKGMLWGNTIGLGLGVLQSYGKFIRLDPTYYYIDYLPIVWNGWGIVLLNLVVFVLVSLVLLVSIMLIARLRPIQAIRFQ